MESILVLINKKQVMLNNDKLVGEASTMGIQPGDWPLFIGVMDDKNEGFQFQRNEPDIHDGEIVGYHYRSNDGAELLVIND